MSKLKARPVPNNKGTYYVEAEDGLEKVLVGTGDSFYSIKYYEWETEEDAIEWIESKDRLELRL